MVEGVIATDGRGDVTALNPAARDAHLRMAMLYRQEAGEILDGIVDRGECEFVSEVGLLFPNMIFMEIMGLPQEDAGAADLLAAERAEEVRDQPIHQLEVGRQRRRVLLRVVKDLFPIRFGVHRDAGSAIDEDEFGPEDEALSLHVGAHRNDAATART